jgi:hypothetical protein
MTIPGTLQDGGWTGFAGRVVFHRRFGKPAHLDPDERVCLVLEGVAGPARVWFNLDLLGNVEGSARFDITDHLAERNDLRVEINAADDRCGIVSEVRLEITASGAA